MRAVLAPDHDLATLGGLLPHFVHPMIRWRSFVLSAKPHPRCMTPGQQAAIVASAQDWAKAQSRGGDRTSEQSASLHFDSAADRAAQSGASDRTQRLADKVAKADIPNYEKAMSDALTRAHIWHDDGQIDVLLIERGPRLAVPAAHIVIGVLPEESE